MSQEISLREDGFVEGLRELEAAGVSITSTSLNLTDPDLPYEVWERLGFIFGSVKRTTSWLIGDWLNFGESVYGEKYAQAASQTNLTEGTLTVYASVCRRVARSRRREELSFGHHDAVAALEPKEQKRWLAEAVKNQWSRRELRAALSASPEAPPPPEQPDWTPGLLGPPETTGATTEALLAPGSAVAVLSPALPLTVNGNSVSAPVAPLAELCQRLVEEAIPQGWFVRIPRSTFDELAAFFAEE